MDKKIRSKTPMYLLLIIISALVAGTIYYFTKSWVPTAIFPSMILVLSIGYLSIRSRLIRSARIKKMEEVFPDFIELVASNLNAGMTVDKSLLLSSRKEFSPLDEEINLLGKDIVTGKDITFALEAMAVRIKSEKIAKTMALIITGIKSGGNLSILLEEIARNMRERSFIEKKATSNVLMYVIFIFVAVAFGAPMLFGLSTALVQILTNIVSSLPATSTVSNLPFTITKVSVSVNFVTYFSIIFLVMINFLASLVIGLVNKGDEKEGIKYLVPLLILSLSVYFVIRIFLIKNVSGIFSYA